MKLNRFEKISFVFVVGFITTVVFFTYNLAVHQGWFESKTSFYIDAPQVEGIFPGSKIQMGGLKLGRVTNVEFLEDGHFKVHFDVFSKYKHLFNKETKVGFLRPFVIGERILDVVPGPSGSENLKKGEEVSYIENFDLIEAFNGKKLGPYIENMKELVDNITFLAKAFSDRKRSEDLIFIFDNLKPLVKNANRATYQLNKMASQMTKNNHLRTLVGNLVTTTTAINGSINEIAEFSKGLPELGKNTGAVMANMSELTLHLNALIPTIQAIAPELPEASKSALKALQEALIVLQAMQKSFFLESSVEEVREEMEKQRRELANEKEGAEND